MKRESIYTFCSCEYSFFSRTHKKAIERMVLTYLYEECTFFFVVVAYAICNNTLYDKYGAMLFNTFSIILFYDFKLFFLCLENSLRIVFRVSPARGKPYQFYFFTHTHTCSGPISFYRFYLGVAHFCNMTCNAFDNYYITNKCNEFQRHYQ